MPNAGAAGNAHRLRILLEGLSGRQRRLETQLARLTAAVESIERQLATLEQSGPALARSQPGEARDDRRAMGADERFGRHAAPRNTPSEATGHLDERFDYWLFEQRFRGSEADIRARQSGYLELFRGRSAVVDLGSGRGELVELLTEHGVGVTGVDSNRVMVAACRERGLRVVEADLFDYLGGLPDGSLDGAAALQVVEHLSPEQIFWLVQLCGDKLEPAAPIVAETPNPHCAVALGNFYLDPTHVRPVPPQLLRFMFERGPFVVEYLHFSAPVQGTDGPPMLDVAGDLPAEIERYQDYAVVARRR